ncbi:riboflavin biosynthesis protein RibF [Listeria floridensis FSL S10-1187]|uniref:Riboflavin biosynthesis protein n=1 Tax=Listeria floridensis FSL S10-1187 TaxID=1265817 RepID=A0ABP3AXS7_9LIST|nr:bifunctional riboflavin kinase/FAD synthetase [Listeria floridensis]EUJ31755.1 riboflavin biosynthesis protein RibF [Listeria floridensis FSL S10-1187]
METYFLHHPDIEVENSDPKTIALGFFDGVHRGHQAVIKEAKRIADEHGEKTAVLTFDPHPSVVLGKTRKQIHYLTPLHEKLEKLEQLGVDIVYVVRFTAAFANLSPEAFVEDYLVALGAKHVVAGFDYSYGKKGAGKMQDLAGYAKGRFDVTTINKQEAFAAKISSTKIRSAIESGDLDTADELLGYPYKIKGTVIHGDKRGRTLGFPTANMKIEDDYLIPKLGIYAVKFIIGGKSYAGMASIGYNVTFKTDQEMSIEVFILDFDREIYGEEAEIEWYHFFRPEMKFSGMEGLIEQLKQDEANTRAYFAK